MYNGLRILLYAWSISAVQGMQGEMIEESEKLKSVSESKAADLADRLVPYSLAGTIIAYVLTRNAQTALALLIILGAFGIITPAVSATLHNLSTIGISVYNMTDLIGA